MTRHYRRDELAAYLDGNDAVVDLAAVAAHLDDCEACGARARDVEQELKVLSELWRPAGARPQAKEERASEYAAMQRQILAEDEEAESFIHRKLRPAPIKTWLDRIFQSPAAITAGLVRRLTREAREQEEREPRRSLAILDVAERVLGSVSAPESMKEELAGTIWKERANAHTMLGDYANAFDGIDRAESFYAKDAVATYLLAFTQWARGNLLYEMNQYAEALPFAQAAAAAFHDFGDDLHQLQVTMLLGAISYEQGDIETALRTWSALLPAFRALGDNLTVARTLANIGCCYLGRFDTANAERYAEEAGQLFRECGAETELLRTRWAFGRAYLRRGDSDNGVAWLSSVALDFRTRGVLVPAAEVELDIIEELLVRERFTEAADRARALVNFFIGLCTKLNAAKALDYLAQATRELRATPELVRSVRHVLLHPEQQLFPSADA